MCLDKFQNVTSYRMRSMKQLCGETEMRSLSFRASDFYKRSCFHGFYVVHDLQEKLS